MNITAEGTWQEEFETGIMKFKGMARSFDLNKLQRQVRHAVRMRMVLDDD